MKRWTLLVLIVLMAPAPFCLAQEPAAGDGEGDAAPLEEKTVETTHSIRTADGTIRYTATAGTLILKDDEEKEKASIFYISYVRNGIEDPGTRPITFSFNGGPGSSSVWLHLGLLGPRRVEMDGDGAVSPPPYRLVENEYTLLGVTDLVFIDPVTTGYSRPAPGEDPKQFHGVDKDVQWVGEFIRLFLTKNERWSSPKYLIGESYGTTRAAGLSGHLQDRHGIYLNGIMLVSSVLQFQTTSFATGNDLPYVLFLPSYTATAWYHGRLDERYDGDLASALADAESFALGEYAAVLMLGDDAPDDRYEGVVRRLAGLTGLSREYVRRTNIRIHSWRFMKELLRERRETTGRLDSRFTGRDRDAVGERPEYDPSYANILGSYTATLNDYVRRDLEFESDLPYEILTGKVYPWSPDRFERRFVDVAETLRSAMTRNPSLKVFVASGYYDLATPYFATEYTFDHMNLGERLRNNVTIAYYEAGHMMYIHLPSLKKLGADLEQFVRASANLD